MIRLDQRDIQILGILQQEGRITKAALAERINLSKTPCWDRLKRLEKAGVIESYGARVSPKVLDAFTFVIMQAELESHQARDFDKFEQAIQAMDAVLDCWSVGGGVDYFLRIATKSVNDYQRLVDHMLRQQIGLKRYYTYIVTKQIKSGYTISETLLSETLLNSNHD